MVLGGKPLREGARAICGEGLRGERDAGWVGL
jgi:hypothetical protein